MPDFGIGETLAAAGAAEGGFDILGALGSLFGLGGEAAAATGAGLGAAGAAGTGAGLADIVGTGAGLFGGTTGLEGTLLAGGSGLGLGEIAGAGVAGGALGTAADFLAAPGASLFGGAGEGFGAAADAAASSAASSGLASGTGGIAGGSPALASLAGSTPTALGGVSSTGTTAGTSVFDTGTAAVPGTSGSVATGGGAAASAAPVGIATPADAASLAAQGGAGAATGTAAPAAGGTSISSLLGDAGSSVLKSITGNPLGTALGVGGLGYNILEGQKSTANQKALTADAQQATTNSNRLTASGEELQQYLSSGKLPDNYQAQVDQAINDAKTTAISNAAAQGLPTDPTKNTALAATLAKIDSSRPNMQAQVAQQLFSSGSSLINAGQSAAGLSGQLYQALVNNDTNAAANTGRAIATLAAALNGKSSATIGNTRITAQAA